MQISGTSPNSSINSSMYIAPAGGGGRASSFSSAPAAVGLDPAAFLGELGDLRDALRGLRRVDGSFRAGTTKQAARATSVASLGLTLTPTATTLTSTAEINTTPTSYTPKVPAFSGSSSSDPTLGGVYDGSNGDDTLTFVVTDGGLVGLTGVAVEVRDSGGGVIDTVSLGFGGANDVTTLSNGLEIAFSSGTLSLGDSFQVEVSATVGEALQPDRAFDGTGDAAANFDSGTTITNGSFTVNGAQIDVFANDTLNDVIARVAASGAGVDLAYDPDTDSVRFTSRTPGSAESIVVAGDTSGLIAALKLDGASEVPGLDSELERSIDSVPELAAISSGTFTINGVDVSIDTASDSLADVLARIESLVPGVTARFDEQKGTVVIGGSGVDDLVLDSGGTSFFSSVGIAAGTFEARTGRGGAKFGDVNGLRDGITKLVRALEGIFEGDYTGFGSATVKSTRTTFDTIIATAFDEAVRKRGTDTLRSGLGLDLVREEGRTIGLDLRRSQFAQAARSSPEDLHALLYSEKAKDGFNGLIVGLADRIDGQIDSFTRFITPSGSSGGLVNVSG
ncbi:hypothetical protein Pla163_03440 [Planctomycetes bacterium Pla163]|uniref:Flagellar cap protein n=1 Tax=Rohdeia mirabilis TaxID=2528008 RepID=A0A518CVJ2_9BACT|nr:hypothetical protein Pla163_03440 [Planctomycetes bacterium Pla163]